MKRKYSDKIVAPMAAFLLLAMLSCHSKKKPEDKTLHNTGIADSLLRPSSGEIRTIRPEKGARVFTVSLQGRVEYDERNKLIVSARTGGRIERLAIKYNYQPIRKGDLIMEIYSPDLVAAQQELLFLKKHSEPDLLRKARQKLLLLGMSEKMIDRVLSRQELLYKIPVYSPVSGYVLDQSSATGNSGSLASAAAGSTMAESAYATVPSPMEGDLPVRIREGQYLSAGEPMFSIYQESSLVAVFGFDQQIASHISKGKSYLFRTLGSAAALESGVIDQILPSQRAGLPFSLIKTYLPAKKYRPGEIIEAFISVKVDQGSWLPSTAVYRSGQQNIVFKKEGGNFIAYSIRSGLEQNGFIQILHNIDEWEIALDAEYIVDSDSFLKPIPYAE